MDISEYLPMFLAEGREHLQELNLSVVRIEEHPDDPETVDEIFRIAHSLKGMSATMGFAGMAALTHEMEDVFELLRRRKGGLGRDAVTVLLRCLDALSDAVDAIEADGAEQIVPEPLIAELRGLIRDRTPGQAADRTGEPAEAAAPPVEAVVDRRVVRIDVQLADDVQMAAVRAYMVLSALGEKGEIVSSAPAQENVEIFDGREIHVWLATDAPEQELMAVAGSVPDVAEALAGVEEPEEPVEEQAVQAAAPATPGEPATPAGKHKSKGAASVRVDAERLDQLMHYMGELVLHRTQVEGLTAQADVPGLSQAMQNLTRTSHALQQMVMQVRMIPVEAVFLRFPRLVRDLSTKLDKQVELQLVGQETELDRSVVDALGDPLVHLVRNSLDHGLEPPAERLAAGKPATGTLEISARHAGGNVIISVRDDGRGIDPAKVARKAAERGLISADQVDSIDAKAAAELLFHPGFSTAEVTSDISGRGVGMDAVRTTVRELGGEVLLHSELGRGTTAQVRLPLTLAIMAAMLVEIEGRPFAVPIDRIERTVRLTDHAVRSVAGARMLVMRDGVLPILDGGARLCRVPTPDADHGVIVRTADARVVISVTRLVGQQELVTRPLPPEVAEHAALSGGAVLPDGQIALIVDCDALGEGAARVPAPALA
jgi:two-component system, chemotaxis family, sensor kinase CheA